jgi:PAS domain S-box-containing protein
LVQRASLSRHLPNEAWVREQALAATSSAILITDPNKPDNPIVYANPTFKRITGYSIEEAIGKNCRFLQGEDRDQPALKELRAAIRKGRECQVLLRNYKKDGTLFWNELSISPVRDEEGHLVSFVGVQNDVTERKRAEEALQYQLGLTRTITNNAADSLFLWDTEGRVTFMNPAAEETFGWSQEELLGEVLHDKMHHHYPDGRPYPMSECALVKVFESGRTLRDHEDVFFRKDGSLIEVACSHAPIVVDGRITGAVLVVRDITERKRVEKALREQTETLEKVNHIGRLLSSELDLQRLVQAVTDEATQLTGARFGAFFYNLVDDRGESYTLYTISGVPREAFSKFPMPRKTEIFGPTFEGERVVRAHDIREDPRYGNNPPYDGMPEGHLPVVSYLAVPVVSRSGEILGGLFFGHPEAGVFGEREEQIAVGLAAQAAIAVDNARLFESMRESEDRLSLAVESTGLGTWDFDPSSGELRWDERCKAMFGLSPEAEVDHETFLAGLHPEERERTDRAVQHALDPASGGGFDLEYRTVGIEDGVERWVSARGQAFFDEGGRAVRFTGTVLDITERKWAEEALRQSELLYRTVMKQATENIFLIDTETRGIVEFNPAFREALGYPEEELRRMTLYDIVAADRKSIDANIQRVLEQNNTFVGERKYRRKDGSLMDFEVSASVILRNGRKTLCVVAHDVTERKKNEEAQRFLAGASASLSSSLDYRATLARVAHLAVPYLADWCAIDILEEDGSLDRLALTHQDPEKVALARELEEIYPPDPEAQRGVPQVLRTGQPELVPEIPDSLLEEAVRDARHREILRELGLKSYMVVPLVARGRTLGAITLVSAESGRRYRTNELELAEELARRAALAVDNARLYRGRSEIARTLQGSLLPSRLPEVPGIEVGLCYLPAGEVEVGGDFYDLFDARVTGEAEHSDTSSSWGVVIGDVCGKGAEAAASLALARHTIRAVAMREIRPSAILAALNEVKRRQRYERDNYKFCTIAYARLETSEEGTERGARIIVSCGGHSAPILLKSDGSIRKIVCSGRALGVFDDANLTDQEAHLAPGDTLLLYTDGVTEARAPDGTFYGEARLASLLRSSVGLDASTVAGRIESAVLDFQENDPRDDVAVLVLRVSE